jgi:hypothetical protein
MTLNNKWTVKVAVVIAMAGAGYHLLRRAIADNPIGPARR